MILKKPFSQSRIIDFMLSLACSLSISRWSHCDGSEQNFNQCSIHPAPQCALVSSVADAKSNVTSPYLARTASKSRYNAATHRQ
ncbi:hypothetical protein ACN38_g4052 [Penicillium nordicum]|uniref:Uncharacterized protein n=1 Tax=Penicillium nordicum TaxID=229535 RepID=A0A0M8PCQ3_9EURO|nr:hypothetical protein ACN38_g4052 [Penicillium nordicum]